MGGEHAELIVSGIKKLLQLHGIAAGELHSEETVRENHMILLEPCAHFAKFFEMSMPINDLFFIPLYRILQEGALYVRVSHIF